MAFQGIPHSRLVQRHISYPSDADSEFAKISIGDEGNEAQIPIILIPRPAKYFYFALNIPSGPYVIWQQWHRDMGSASPGVIWFLPVWNRISHIITRATITYNAPTKDCPTADNVLVNVNLSLTFRIGPDVDAARNFVYRLGAHRFDELLSAECEEGIRGLVYSVTHDKVNDLREEFASGMLATLNSKFISFGVQILNVKITDVGLPTELQQRLEKTTAFKTKMGEQEKSHENRVRVLEDEATQELETIRETNARKIQEISSARDRYAIKRREMEEQARGDSRVQEVRAMTEADVALKKAQGDEVVEKVKARQDAEALMKKTQATCQRMKIESEKEAHVMIKRSEVELTVKEMEAEAMVVKAEAEALGAEALEEKRKYELEWARLKILKTIAGKGRKFITGEKGEQILNQLIPSTANC